jgi:hypothetical protein
MEFDDREKKCECREPFVRSCVLKGTDELPNCKRLSLALSPERLGKEHRTTPPARQVPVFFPLTLDFECSGTLPKSSSDVMR